MSIPTGIYSDAPVRARHEIGINAPLDTVWRLHADVNSWPAWQTDITAAHIDGAFQPGTSFEWTSYGFTVISTGAGYRRSFHRALRPVPGADQRQLTGRGCRYGPEVLQG